jgi:hypothetical protein
MRYQPFGVKIAMLIAVAIFIFTACEKDIMGPGFGDLDNRPDLGTLLEMPLVTYSISSDSVRTNALDQQFVGWVHDPAFGKTEASFFLQFDLAQTSLDLGNNPVVDSVVWEVPFTRTFGNQNMPFRMLVHESDEAILRSSGIGDSLVFSNGSIETGALLSDYTFEPKAVTIDGVGNTPAQPGLRIPLDKQYFQEKIVDGLADPSLSDVFSDNNEFVKYFKGLVVSAGPESRAILQLVVFAPNNASLTRVRIFYSAQNNEGDTIRESFSLVHNNQNAVFNYYRQDRAQASFDLANQDTVNGETDVFIQSMAGTSTVIGMPGLKQLRDSGFVINYAEIVLPMRQGNFLPGFDPFLVLGAFYRREQGAVPIPILDDAEPGQFAAGGELMRNDPRRFTYRFRITRQVNRIILNEDVPESIILAGSQNSGYRRVILNGNRFQDDPPVLKIYYTKLTR